MTTTTVRTKHGELPGKGTQATQRSSTSPSLTPEGGRAHARQRAVGQDRPRRRGAEQGDLVAGVRVVADSACDLPSSLAEAHGIEIVPLDVRLGEWGPEEMKLVGPAEFWRRCAMSEALPETSSPSPGAFAESFTRAATKGAPPWSVSRSPPACRGPIRLRARGRKKCGGESTSEWSTLGR